ncbi:MAG: UvrD-helicase domain-containing protein [Rhodospirillales bacterium]|jgi:DNA helicase-2/ATP-dependent DNA helicase PcrA|nr:UvrD-helicase domain-containing protein [Rhodospirillales bacterium]MBT4006824.1 UvrD-helicase domain-containing protein [Rhodospirillales bacterium]MBT5113149.1 UvrD-helicase domain-containing protein [Rhodospirillales bacterium]MBT5673025.1 UvrD-helicase domain-containing protein [Rhodospirillales bacterium]MBT6187702.1 UvrD-helicase domain-containing protein [Rhodospirillales bacterium]
MSDPFEFSENTPEAHPESVPASGPEAEPKASGPVTGGAMAAGDPPYLAMLNPEQREAAGTLDGAVLVLAGAGTGKTRVLVTRLTHILMSRRAFPGQILAVTFTNKAAREMMERVGNLLGGGAEGLWLGTFHSISARILRAHAEMLGLKSNFTILDTDDQHRLLRQVMEAENVDYKKWPPRALNAIIQRWKDRGLTPDKVTPSEASEFASGKALNLYRLYQSRLKTLNACDFGDLLLHNLTLFTKHPDVLADYQRRFKYILVDEYQDTNVSQYLWLRLLAQGGSNVCCVGDDDQSIYGWRGAEVGNILRFEKDFPGAHIVRLERNYRSTPQILAAASGLIAHNEGRLGKTLWTEGDDGEKVRVTGVWDGDAEARDVAETIEAIQRGGTSLNEIAVLVRTGSQTRSFEERFITCAIPYRVIGGPRFYERKEIRDAVAYFRVIAQPDDDLAFERIINTPRRGLGNTTLQVAHVLARAEGTSLVSACGALIGSDDIRPQARTALARVLEDFSRWRAQAQNMNPSELAEIVLDESGYAGMWQNDKSVEAPGRLENLKELVSALEDFESLDSFLEHVSLVMEHEDNTGTDMVNIMTLHGAKGLEFDVVFLPGWEEGLFPHQRAMDEQGAAGLEEERRLAYVGLTRARKLAYISFAANRRLYNQWNSAIPSRFIEELPKDHVEVDVSKGLYGGSPPEERQKKYGGGGSGGSAHGQGYGGKRRSKPSSKKEDAGSMVAATPDGLTKGSRVFHQKFGYGRVQGVEGNKLDISFDKAGRKKVMASFVNPA